MPFLSRNVNIRHSGSIILDYAPGEFFCWHFYARRRGRILIMPDWHWQTSSCETWAVEHICQCSALWNQNMHASCVKALLQNILQLLTSFLHVTIALWVKPCWKVEIGEFTKMFPSGPIFMNLNYFRQNIWRFSTVQFHFWYILGD